MWRNNGKSRVREVAVFPMRSAVSRRTISLLLKLAAKAAALHTVIGSQAETRTNLLILLNIVA